MTAARLGSRGLRSNSTPVRPVPVRPAPPPASREPAPSPPPPAPSPRRAVGWIGPLVGIAAGCLIASWFAGGFGPDGPAPLILLQHALLGGAILALVTLLRWRRAVRALKAPRAVAGPGPAAEPPPRADLHQGDSSLDEGIRDIRRTDPRFEPTRLVGYVEMLFRSTHAARSARDVASLGDRVTPELHAELQAQSDASRSLGHASRFDDVEVRAQITEAWSEGGRDYVTAYVDGTMLDYTVDEVSGALVAGSKTTPAPVEAFWTLTRPSGLHPWMLSAIQTS